MGGPWAGAASHAASPGAAAALSASTGARQAGRPLPQIRKPSSAGSCCNWWVPTGAGIDRARVASQVGSRAQPSPETATRRARPGSMLKCQGAEEHASGSAQYFQGGGQVEATTPGASGIKRLPGQEVSASRRQSDAESAQPDRPPPALARRPWAHESGAGTMRISLLFFRDFVWLRPGSSKSSARCILQQQPESYRQGNQGRSWALAGGIATSNDPVGESSRILQYQLAGVH